MKQKLLAEITLIYIIIGVSGYLSFQFIPAESDMLRYLIADLMMTIVAYLCSLYKRNSSVYDPYWTVIPFFFLVMWWWLYGDSFGAAHYLVAAEITFWSWRLTYNWYRSTPGWHHEDWRYVNFRKQFGSRFEWVNFFGIHLYPTLIVFLSMTGLFWLYDGGPQPLNSLILSGCIMAFGGTLLEFFADNVIHRERQLPGHVKGKCIRRGLWKYSRNPNYLGEMLFWIGLAQIGLGSGAPIWTLTGAAGMILMFMFASIPMKEKRLMTSRTDFAQYKEEVSILIPMKPLR